MDLQLNYPKKEFKKELKRYIIQGENSINKCSSKITESEKIESLQREYDYWSEEIEEFLNTRFEFFLENEVLKEFQNSTKYNFEPFIKSFSNKDVDKNYYQLELLKSNYRKRIDVLIKLDRKVKFIDVTDQYISANTKSSEMNKIFISHSSLDAKYVEKIIDILEAIGVPSNRIFCSSFEGYAVKLGNDFLEDIRNELDNDVLVLFILSKNFYSSVVSLCEMGATWVKTSKHIPILIPPFDYKDVKGVIPTTNGMKINEKAKYNSLKLVVEDFLEIEPINISVWERKRDNTLKELKKLMNNSSSELVDWNKVDSTSHIENNDYYSNAKAIIKEQSKKEWPNDFEMQLDYINRQTNAVEKLKNHNPMDIDEEEFKQIRNNGRKEWESDFEMQLDFEQRQVESLRRLNEM